jgi:ADP-ribose pyrophosphatase
MPKVLAPGENRAVDAAVVAEGHLLLVLRGDGGGWALPGGMAEQGEDDATALRRELAEEAGVIATAFEWITDRLPVADPRNRLAGPDPAWITTRVGLVVKNHRPDVAAGSDAKGAIWAPLVEPGRLDAYLFATTGTPLYSAHDPLIAAALRAVA